MFGVVVQPCVYRLQALVVAALLLGASTICAQTLRIQVQHVVDNDSVVLEKKEYVNAVGQSYRIDRFRYYISNLRLVSESETSTADTLSYLVDEDDASSKLITVPQPKPGRYTALEFIIGVDSIHNCAGLQEGTLEPIHGMFWAWNTGYIFLKLDGHSAASSAPGGILEYHIGGFQWPNNCIRRVRLSFDNTLELKAQSSTTISIKVNVAELFRTPQSINFSQLPSVTDATNATRIADNYADMFSLVAITQR